MEDDSNKQPEDFNLDNNSTNTDLKTIWASIKTFIFELLDIRLDTDRKGTIEDIKGNISMKGHTAWVLVFSILIG